MARHFMFRSGTRGAATLLGLYAYTGSGTPTFLGDTYDRRFGKAGNYIPLQYGQNLLHQICTANDVVPLFSVAPGGRYAFYFRGVTGPRWLFTSDGVAAPVSTAVNVGVMQQDLCALYVTDSTFYAIDRGESISSVWTSSTGAIWTQGSPISGMVRFDPLETSKTFLFNGDVYLLRPWGLFRNVANDLVSWEAIPLLLGYSDSTCYVDVAWDATAIVVVAEGTDAGTKYNVILRSTDGVTFTELRKVAQTADTPSAGGVGIGAYPLQWRNMTQFGTGFCIYGCSLTGAFAHVLKSTDHGASFTMAEVNTPYAVTNVSGYPGATKVVAAIPVDGPGFPIERLHESNNGINFSALSF